MLNKAIAKCRLAVLIFSLLHKVLPYRNAGIFLKRFVLQCQVYPADHGLVEALHAVSGEEENSIILFELAKKDRNQGVELSVAILPTGEEYISLVEQENRFPATRCLEDIGQILLHSFRVDAELSSGDLESVR